MVQTESFDTFHSYFRRNKVADLSTSHTEERQASTNRQFCCIPGLAEALERGIREYRRMLQLLSGNEIYGRGYLTVCPILIFHV